VSTATPSYKGHRCPVEIIDCCVWLYFRFPLSFREVEEPMPVRGVVVSYETIRRWCAKFGQAYANQLRRRRPRPGDKWRLDEVFIRINGTIHYLWGAVDQHGNVLAVVGAVTAKRHSGQAVLPQATQGLAVCGARVGNREAGQLQGRTPRADGVGDPPAVAIPQQSRRKLPSAHPAT
jgi:DDE domain